MGNFGTGVRASILKPTPIIYLAFEKYDPFIYFIVHNVDIFIGCPLILYILRGTRNLSFLTYKKGIIFLILP